MENNSIFNPKFNNMRMLLIFALFLISNIANAQCTCTGNLVTNPSFESGTTGWSWGGGTLNVGGGAIACGSASGDFQISNNSSNYVSQTIASGTIAAGSNITATVHAGVHNNSFYHHVFINYFNSSWGWISNTAVEVNKVLSASPVGPQLYTINSVVPAGTYYIQVGFSGDGDWIKTDQWCATVTPLTACNPNSTTAASGFCAPTLNCSGATKFHWSQSINQTNGTPSVFRLVSGSTNSYTLTGTSLPAAFASAITINIDEVVSWDGYSGRNTVSQANERWRLVFKKSGNTVYSSPYTNDVPDNQTQGFWQGALGSSFFAPNGIDQVIFEHFDVANGSNGPGSVVPVAFCLNYSACNNAIGGGTIGSDQTFCGASFNPANLTNIASPTGGSGTLEYLWLSSLDGGTTTSIISGATSSTYDPPTITQTTWYRRCARRSGCTNYDAESNWVKAELTSCCTATITGLQFKDPTGTNTAVTPIVNGGTYSISSLPASFNVEALLTGNMESVRFTLSGSATSSNIENAVPWDFVGSGSVWPHGPGSYTMLVEAFSLDNAGGTMCATQTFNFNIVSCSNVTDGGTVGSDQTFCGTSFDPANITNLTLPTGGSGTLEYVWLQSNDGGNTHIIIPGATGSSYDPGVITQTTWYRRCARRSSCTDYIGETNWIMKKLSPIPSANAGNDITLTCTTTSLEIGATAVSGLTYSWSPVTNLSSAVVSKPFASPNVTTTYTVTVTNADGCTATDAVLVTVNKTLPTADAGPDKNLTCLTTSAVIGTPSGAGSVPSYSWNPSAGLSSTTIAQPTANPAATTTYTVTVTNANGCTAQDIVVVYVDKNLPVADAGADKTLTCSVTSTSIGTTQTSGNSYSWSPSTGLSATNIAMPIASPTVNSTYTVTVTGVNGCINTDIVIITMNKTAPPANAGPDKTLDCSTTSTTIGSTSTVGYTYSWSPTTALSSSSASNPTANPTTTTTYTVTVTNTTNGCTATDAVIVNVNSSLPTANAGPDRTLTCSTTNTLIGTAAISGNLYSWNPSTGLNLNNTAQPTASPTTSTTYTVTVTGSNGCTATDVVVVNVDKTTPTANAGPDKNLNCTISSSLIGTTAIAGNTYSWSPITNLTSTTIAQPTASPAATTTYTVTVTGANGCTSTDVVVVNVDNSTPTANAGPDKTLTCSTTSTQIGTAAIGNNSYSWNPSTGLNSTTVAQPNANPASATTYTVTVTGTNGCTSTDVVVVNVDKTLPIANAGPTRNLTCTTTSATIGTTALSGNTYSWSPSSGLNSTTSAVVTANPTTSTTYTVTVTGANGCTATSTVAVNVNTAPPTTDAGPDKTINCNVNSVVIGTVAVSGNTYSWNPFMTLSSNNVAQPTANPNVTTTYTVTVTGANGCSATDVVVVNVDITAPVANAGADKDVCSTNSTTIGTSAVSGSTYSWNPSTGLNSTSIAQPTANPSVTTTYTVTVTGANGCTATDVVIVNFREGSVGNYVWNDINGNGQNDEAANAGINGVSVQLYTTGPDNVQGNSDDVLQGTTVTSNDNSNNPGFYNFKICTSGNYYVKFPTSTTSTNKLTTQTATTATDNNSDANVTTGNSPVFAINTSGTGNAKNNNTIDAGFVPMLSLGNLVWNDLNKDGIKQTSELGIQGAIINLYNDNNADGTADGPSIANTTSNSNGLYVFNSLNPGNYILGVTPPNPTSGNAFVSSTVNETNPNSNVDNNDNGIVTVSGETRSGTITLLAGTEPTGETPNNGTSPDADANLTVDFAFYQPVNISGNDFNDVNGLTNSNVDGVGIGSPSGTQLFANLINAAGNVVATTPIGQNGSYQFNDVQPNSNYSMVLSTIQGTIGNASPAANLPSGWLNTGEDCCDNSGSDASVNGTITFSVVNSDLPNINFGIQQPPTPGTNTQPTQINPGGTVCVNVPANAFSGTDPSNGTIVSLTITSFPTNTTSITVNGNVYTVSNFPAAGITIPTSTNGQPTQPICVDPINGAVIVNIPYKVTDNAGASSSPTGYVQLPFGTLMISGNVYNDINGPANVDGTGVGLPSGTQLYANLVNATGNVVATTLINQNGTYQFLNVDPNATYTMVLSTTQGTVGNPAPTASLPTGWSNVSEDCCDNSGNDGTTNGIVTVVVNTSDVPNINFGITQPLSLGNLVWNDVNKNGLKETSESGIQNASVNLYVDANSDGIPDGSAILNTTTNSNGLYVFNGLTPGNYVVGVTPPAVTSGNAFTSSPVNEINPNLNNDNNDNGITIVSGETRSGTITLSAGVEPTGETPNNGTAPDANSNLTVDFGFYQPINISGNVFNDITGPANVDGTGIGLPSGTQLYANLVNASGNVVASVPVNANGTFNFEDVQPNTTFNMILSTTQGTVGNPAPAANLPLGWSNVSEDCCDNTGNDGTTNGATPVVVGTSSVTNVNFGITQPLSVGNTVWNDINKNGIKESSESGIQGATVKLYADANSDGTPDGAALQNTTTNSNGLYVFNGLTPGNYVVGVTPPAVTSGNAFVSSPINESNPNSDIDNNDNGIVTVSGETRSGTITLLAGTEPTGETPNNGTAPDANSNLTVDFAFYQPINVSGNVFNDITGPANVDGTGIGLPSGTQLYANLVNASGNVVASVPVNANGTFNFEDVQPNTTFNMILSTTQGTPGNPAPSANLPLGWSNVSEDCCDNTGNDGTTNGATSVVVGTTSVTNVNFGIAEPLSLGNLVWNDINKDGLKDASESGIQGATVKLYSDANSDGTPDGAALQNTTTNSNGLYVFNGLTPGNYLVGVTPPTVTSGNTFVSSLINESNPNSDIDNNDNGILTVAGETRSGTITLAPSTEPTGETPNNGSAADVNSNLTVDFGFYQPVKIEGNVFVDNNGPLNVDGTGIGSIKGQQFYANLVNPTSGNVIATKPIATNGTYQFLDVMPNTSYRMVLSLTNGTIGSPAPAPSTPLGWVNVSEDCCDNTGNDGTTDGRLNFNVVTTDVPNVNFGIKQPMSIGNQVWKDQNRNGVIDGTESGIQGANVNLYLDANSDGIPDGTAIQNTTTDANGLYIFNDLVANKYVVGVTPPTVSGGVYTSSITGEEMNPNFDVDFNDNGVVNVSGETRSKTVELIGDDEPLNEQPNNTTTLDENANLTVDFGFFLCPSNFTFTPQFVCAGATLNLATLEPTNYTGGVWSLNGVTVTNLNVSQGTYVYTFQDGTCVASGSVTLAPNVPDYTPTISIAPSAITGISNVRVIIKVEEILNRTSCTPIYVLVPRLEPRFSFSFLPTATTIGGVAVRNADWQYFATNPNFYIWKYVGNATFPSQGNSNFGYIGSYNPNDTDGETTFSVQIFQGSGGETNQTNNTDSESLIYFR